MNVARIFPVVLCAVTLAGCERPPVAAEVATARAGLRREAARDSSAICVNTLMADNLDPADQLVPSPVRVPAQSTGVFLDCP